MKLQGHSYLLLLCLSFICIGCSGDSRTELFTVENEVEFILPAGLNTIETHIFVVRNIPTFFETNLKSRGIAQEDIVSIGSGRALITGTFQQIDYDFIRSISIRALSQSDPNINREMYYRENVPFSHNGDLELLSSISELREIMKDNFFDMEIRVQIRDFVPGEIRNKLIFSYAVFDTE